MSVVVVPGFGITIQGASHSDCEVAQVGDGTPAGVVRGWADAPDEHRQAASDTLFEQIGRQKVELDWIKKKVGIPERPLESTGSPLSS